VDNDKEESVFIEENCEAVRYDSWEELLASSEVTVAMPDRALFQTEFDMEYALDLCGGERVALILSKGEDKFFSLSQTDYRRYESYSSATAYAGESVNERSFTGSQGLNYVMFDSMTDGQITETHAVISVNGRDLAFTFRGFDEETIEAVLGAMDLSVYFQDK